MCGLLSKLNCPEFINYINNFDIIGLQETKLDDIDSVDVQGFEIFTSNRHNMARNRSGGIALLVKSELAKQIEILESDSKLILMFKIKNEDIHTFNNSEIICGIVYIPPIRSRYSHDDPFLELQLELDKYMGKNMLLLGDFNSRVSNKADYIRLDDFIYDINGNIETYEDNQTIFERFDTYGIPLDRSCVDYTCNEYGTQLLEFCKNNDLFILNGRLNPDHSNCKPTCKGKSVIDFFYI